MQRRFILRDGKVVETVEHDAPIAVFLNPDEAEKRYMIDVLKIDEHTLGTTIDPQGLGRVEFEPEHTAVIFKYPKRYTATDEFYFKVNTSGYFVFADKLIVVVEEDHPLFEGRQFSRVNSLSDVFLRMLFQHIVHFTEHLKVMNTICDELGDKINTAMKNEHLLNMFTIEKSLVYYLNAISSNGRVLNKLKLNATKLHLTVEAQEYLDDLIIENAQCSEQANTHAQVLASLMDARASLVSNNLNVMMKNLNSIVIAIALPSFFAGMGGMSEFTMMFGEKNWIIAYPVFLVAMAALGVTTFFITKRIEKYWR